MPKLRVNAIAKGKYWRAGEDIPPEELPPNLLKYVATEPDIEQQRQDAVDIESKPALRKTKASFVKRDGRYVPASEVELTAGEMLYWHRKRQFGVDEKWIAFGRVGTEV